MKNRRNYYRILHVQPDAPVEIIKASYRTLMQKLQHHPDLGGNEWSCALINEAYAVVTDPIRREAYDRELAARKAGYQPENEPATAGGFRACQFCQSAHPYQSVADPDLVCGNCGAPLHPADRPRLEQEQRAVARIPRRQQFRYYTRWPQRKGHRGWTVDVSLNGLKFVALRPLQTNRLIKIDSTLCAAVGRVRNCQVDQGTVGATWQVGVEFVTVRFERINGSFVSAQA